MGKRETADGPDGKLVVTITTDHSYKWWLYLAENIETVGDFVLKYGGASARRMLASCSMSYHDAEIVTILQHAFDEAPDDVADMTHPDFAAAVMLYRLIDNYLE